MVWAVNMSRYSLAPFALPTDIKLLSLFSGIGAFEKALDRLGINYELVNYCEIDKYASRSYAAIHNVSEDLNLWDVTKVDEKALPKDIDLLTYGFPCQDISLAGKQQGLFNDDGTKTRSGLFFDALRIIEATQPKIAIAENVKPLIGESFKEQFKLILDSLSDAGYNNYYEVLNAKDFGVPQNRERVFIVSIRKDLDDGFSFPNGFPLIKKLKDVLEDSVDEKYYLSQAMVNYISSTHDTYTGNNRASLVNKEIASSVTTKEGITRADASSYIADGLPNNFDIKQVGQIYPNSGNPQVVEPMAYDEQNRYIRQDGTVGTLTTDGSSPKHNNRVLVPFADESVKPSAAVNFEREKQQIINSNKEIYQCECESAWQDNKVGLKVSPTLRANNNNNTFAYTGLRIRKLTPLETWRLMGFDDEDFRKAEKVNSNAQLYKQAGNSIVVDVLEHLLTKALKAI